MDAFNPQMDTFSPQMFNPQMDAFNPQVDACSPQTFNPRMDTFSVILRKAARGMLGISLVAVQASGPETVAGLAVTEVLAGGAADLHNATCAPTRQVKPGDVIVSVNGAALDTDLLHRALADVATSATEQSVLLCLSRPQREPDAGAKPRPQRTSAKSLPSGPGGMPDGRAFGSTASSEVSTDASSALSPPTSSECSSEDWLPECAPSRAPSRRGQAVAAAEVAVPRRNNVPKAEAEARPLERPTTLMLGQLPGHFSRRRLEAILDEKGFAGLYDFAYVPTDLRTNLVFHYAFVNLVDCDVAAACKDALAGYAFGSDAGQVMTTSWARSRQGLQAHVERYRDSPLMHEDVPDQAKPALYFRGARVAFPPPKEAPLAPLQKRRPRSLPMVPPEVQEVPETRLR